MYLKKKKLVTMPKILLKKNNDLDHKAFKSYKGGTIKTIYRYEDRILLQPLYLSPRMLHFHPCLPAILFPTQHLRALVEDEYTSCNPFISRYVITSSPLWILI